MSAHSHIHDAATPHVHVHAAVAAPVRAVPGRSLLRMSLAERLGIAAVFIAAIWLSVFWAIR